MKILYFASFRERLGCAEERLDALPDPATVKDIVNELVARGNVWAQIFGGEKFLVSVNQEVASLESPVPENAEVAFFPPVTGG